MKKFIQNFYMAILFLLLYAPIFVLMLFSFNDSKSRVAWHGFTLDWYVQMFQDERILHSLYVTLLVAVISAIFATILGTAAAIGIQKMGRRGRGVYLTLNSIPMSSSDTIMGVSFMLLFSFFAFEKGYLTLILAHVTFCIPYVVLNVMPKLRQLDKNAYEAALDLGATPRQAFWKVIIPEIMPGIVTGAIMAFTISIDDFVVSYFTAGNTSQPLSVVIYSMVRRRISPKINAVSTLLFVFILILLIIINVRQSRALDRRRRGSGAVYKKRSSPVGKCVLAGALCVLLIGGPLAGLLRSSATADSQVVNVYNWGEYMDESLLEQFEAETGYKVVYTTFDSNESMYARMKTESYDVVIPSDYMVARLIEEDMLQPINYENIPNFSLIDEQYTRQAFDPAQQYSVPYTWGVVGVIYNQKHIDPADIGSWDLLWNPKYAGEVAMFDNPRDAIGITLKYLGHSLNTEDPDALRQAAALLTEGKQTTFQGLFMDQILEKLPNEELYAAPYYNGDAVTMMEENPDLAFYVPEEGTNLFVDAMCIPKSAKNVEGAEAFIDFMCSTEAAAANADYIGYSSPQREVYEMQPEEIRNDPVHYPNAEIIANSETYLNLSEETNKLYTALWAELLK